MKRALGVLGIALVGVLAIVALRTLAARPAAAPQDGPALAPIAFDEAAALERFSAALRIRTISRGDAAARPRDPEAFAAFHRLLEQSYPAVHRALERERIAEWSLLYRWPGSDPELAPALLMGHFDVVPVDSATAGEWQHPPFGGVVADGYVWGRGSLDDKINVMGLLEAAEALLASGFRPQRSLLLAFGHDEEVGGHDGAAAIARVLEARGSKPALVLDEGGAVVGGGIVPGMRAAVAAIGIAEKGSVSLELTVETEGGHSSAPPRQTAIGILAAAIARLERHGMPSHFDGPMRELLERMAPHTDLPFRALFSNLWLFAPAVEALVLRNPVAAPAIRTTTAVTMIEGGIKQNVLPSRARAVANFRLYPGDTREVVTEHVRRAVDDPRVAIAPFSRYREASAISDTTSGAYALLERCIRESFPDAVPGPFLTPGGTDARHFRHLTRNAYGFMPVRSTSEDLRRSHGVNERIAVASYLDAVRFYGLLMRRAGDWSD